MYRFSRAVLVVALACGLALVPEPTEVLSQSAVCLSERADGLPNLVSAVMDFGVPDAHGVTVQDRLSEPGPFVMHAYKFGVPEGGARAAFVYVGDQWYDIDLAVYSVSQSRSVACWQTTGARARSERAQTRQIQFIRPDEQIIQELPPGDYVLLAGVETPSVAGYDPNREFTIRVALTPKICALNPPNVPSQQYPGLLERAGDAWYQVGLALDPPEEQLGPFSLISFSALISPPYLDLFDFAWEVDGQAVPDATLSTLQVPVPALQKTPDGRHTVRLTARGVRPYPDPEQTHIPLQDIGGALSVECSFTVQ